MATVSALAIFVLAFTLRITWVERVNDPFLNIYSDMGGYIERALQLVNRTPEPYPRWLAFYPPGTHCIYAMEMWLLGWDRHVPILIAHCLWGAAVAPCVLLLSLRVVSRLWTAIPVGLLGALWQPQLVYSGFFSSEQLAVGIFAVSAWLLTVHFETRRWALLTAASVVVAYFVRPQFLLTALLLVLACLVYVRKVHPIAARRRRARLILWVFAMAVFAGAVRYMTISGRPGLIADEDALQRLYADTEVGSVCSHDAGLTWCFGPPSKGPARETQQYDFQGYIGDREQLERGRRRFLRGRSWGWRAKHLLSNVELLAFRNELWPEENGGFDLPWRRAYNDLFKNVIVWLLPFAAIGILSTAARPSPVLVISVAHVLTVVAVAAFFWGEVRYRVPYDTFLILLALEGVRRIVWVARTAGGALWRRALARSRRGDGSLEAPRGRDVLCRVTPPRSLPLRPA